MTIRSWASCVLKSWILVCMLALGAWLFASCGGTSRAGTDSQTHWLGLCTSDMDCGALSCICGICSKTCENNPECGELGVRASCLVPESCEPGDGDRTACAVSCDDAGDCADLGADLECRNGQCSPPRSTPIDPACEAMDAQSSGDDCLQISGYAFNGVSCEPIICGCSGDDCGELFSTIDECDDAKDDCYVAAGVERTCQVDEQCVLVSRKCCGALSELDAVLALSVFSEAAWCAGADCAEAPQAPKPTLHAPCVAGRCEAIDVAPIATCSSDEDCMVRSKGCCNCPLGVPPETLMAVAVPDEYYEFAGCSVQCDQCVTDPPDGVGAECSAAGLCSLVLE